MHYVRHFHSLMLMLSDYHIYTTLYTTAVLHRNDITRIINNKRENWGEIET